MLLSIPFIYTRSHFNIQSVLEVMVCLMKSLIFSIYSEAHLTAGHPHKIYIFRTILMYLKTK